MITLPQAVRDIFGGFPYTLPLYDLLKYILAMQDVGKYEGTQQTTVILSALTTLKTQGILENYNISGVDGGPRDWYEINVQWTPAPSFDQYTIDASYLTKEWAAVLQVHES